jgi:hypothetical protein
MNNLLQACTTLLWLAGTFMLAFGLRIKEGIDPSLRKELKIEEKGLIAPSDVRQRPFLIYGGLIVVTMAAAAELYSVFCLK